MRRLWVALVAALALASCAQSGGAAELVVARVADGDTLTLTNGSKIRLVQIDAPEIAAQECYAQAARRELLRLAPVGSHVALEGDPALGGADRTGRLLRYVKRGTTNVNLELVRRGAAAPYFFGGDRGRYASQLMAAASVARSQQRGFWGASPRTRLNPNRQVETGSCSVR